jgi:hypothetical protein
MMKALYNRGEAFTILQGDYRTNLGSELVDFTVIFTLFDEI